MIKSKGEQSQGQASLHGFSSQYSQRVSSARSWWGVMKNGSPYPFSFKVGLLLFTELKKKFL